MAKTEKCPYLGMTGSCTSPSRDKCKKKRLPLLATIFCYHVPVVTP